MGHAKIILVVKADVSTKELFWSEYLTADSGPVQKTHKMPVPYRAANCSAN